MHLKIALVKLCPRFQQSALKEATYSLFISTWFDFRITLILECDSEIRHLDKPLCNCNEQEATGRAAVWMFEVCRQQTWWDKPGIREGVSASDSIIAMFVNMTCDSVVLTTNNQVYNVIHDGIHIVLQEWLLKKILVWSQTSIQSSYLIEHWDWHSGSPF